MIGVTFGALLGVLEDDQTVELYVFNEDDVSLDCVPGISGSAVVLSCYIAHQIKISEVEMIQINNDIIKVWVKERFAMPPDTVSAEG